MSEQSTRMDTCMRCLRYTSISQQKTICKRCEGDTAQRKANHHQPAIKTDSNRVSPLSTPGGFIYLLCGDGRYYKIGKAKDVEKRVASIGAFLPFPVELLHCFYCHYVYQIEHALHEFFAEKRLNGEWFNLMLQDVEWIKILNTKNVHRELEISLARIRRRRLISSK